VVRAIADAYKITEIGKVCSLAFAEMVDGTQLTKNIMVMIGGVKVVDLAAHCPITGKLLMLDDGTLDNAQSQNKCIPLFFLLAKETKDVMEMMQPMFDFFRMLADPSIDRSGMDYHWESLAGFKPFDISALVDLSAQWKCLKKGGACKRDGLFCPNCTCHSDFVHNPNLKLCERWCSERIDDPTWSYHHEFISEETVEDLKKDVSELRGVFNADLEKIKAESNLLPAMRDKADAEVNENSIMFIPPMEEARDAFASLLTEELLLHGESPLGSIEDMRSKLMELLESEEKLQDLKEKLDHATPNESALFLLFMSCPCILHLDN
jgi:hypothetical protein